MTSASVAERVTQCSDPTSISAGLAHEIVTGREQILRLQGLLATHCAASGQTGQMDHLEYFLSMEAALRKTPHLLLLGATKQQALASPHALVGAVLLFEYRVLGQGARVFATEDTAGRRTVIAAPEVRALVAKVAAETLMRHGAEIVLQSFGEPETSSNPDLPLRSPGAGWRVATRTREIPSYLELAPTLDATLARMGQHSRRNLRYYRRRAENQLGAHFVPHVTLTRSELQAFNRECTFAVPDDLVSWRFDALASTRGMSISGVRDREGRWLSMIAARHFDRNVEIDWQMNRADLPESSLGTVMRAFFMEHEIAQGSRRLYMEGGTSHAMRFSFAVETVRDLIVVRRPWLPRLQPLVPKVHRVSSRFVPLTNFVLQMLAEPGLDWGRWS